MPRTDPLGRFVAGATSRSRVACRYAFLFNTTLSEAADALGVRVASVSATWPLVYPDLQAFKGRRTMSKHQTRISISVDGRLGAELRAFAEKHNTSASHVASLGIRAALDGLVPFGDLPSPDALKAESFKRNGTRPGRQLLSREELDARCAARDAARKRIEAQVLAARRVATAPPDAGLSRFVRVAVSDATGALVDDQLERAAHVGVSLTDGEVFDAAVNRMLDQVGVEVAAGALCATCLESDLCRCNGQRRAVGR
jgi:hypothetical protein